MLRCWKAVVSRSVHAPAGSSTGLTNLLVNPKFTAQLSLPIMVGNLWVEDGVIWQLPSLLVGFTSYSAATTFFSSLKGTGMESAPANWYQGLPFSATDFPILYEQNSTGRDLLIWPSLYVMGSAQMFLSMLPGGPYKPSHGNAASAGAVVPVSALQNFSANSPSGMKTFQAQYILYAPGGITKAASGKGSGISQDMGTYSWEHPQKTNPASGDPYFGN